MEKAKRKLYQYVLNQLQDCVYYVLNQCEQNTQSIIDFLKKVESDFNIMVGVINCLTIKQEDILEEAFSIVDNHPIIYSNETGWKMIKHYFNELKELVLKANH